MMSAVGELATLAYRSSVLTTFEQDEVSAVLGHLAVCLSTLGEAYRVNIGEAALQRINQQLSRSDVIAKRSNVSPSTAAPPKEGSAVAFPKPRPSTQAESASLSRTPSAPPPETSVGQPIQLFSPTARPSPSPAVHDPLLLSPTSSRNFFPSLDAVAQCPPDEFNRLGLTWIAPRVDGQIVELIPNGANIAVTHDKLAEFLARVKPFRDSHQLLRDAPPALQPLPPALSLPVAAEVTTTKHIDVPAPPGYNAQAVEKMFSPTHFQHGLFSPHSNATGFDVPYAVTAPSQARDSQGSTEPEAAAPPADAVADFFAQVRKIECGEISGAKIGLLRLKFTMPTAADGKFVELTPNGSHIPVTSANVDNFLHLIKEKQNHQQGKVRRTESIKRLEVSNAAVYDPTQDAQKFSPTHFAHNIFAPHDERKHFVVDYDREEDCLPPALRNVAAAKDESADSIAEYLEYLRSRGVEGFRGVIEQVERNPRALSRYSVTYCIPSSLAGHMGGEDAVADILIVDGRNVRVEEADAPRFLKAVRKYL